MPIKIVEKPLQSRKHVVNGTGISAVIAATLFLTKKIEKKQPQQKAWRVHLILDQMEILSLSQKRTFRIFHMKRGTLQKNGRPQMEPLKQQR